MVEYYSYVYIDELQFYKVRKTENKGYSDDEFIYEVFQYDYMWDLIKHYCIRDIDYIEMKKMKVVSDGFWFELMIRNRLYENNWRNRDSQDSIKGVMFESAL
jgi:hypothetical protein